MTASHTIGSSYSVGDDQAIRSLARLKPSCLKDILQAIANLHGPDKDPTYRVHKLATSPMFTTKNKGQEKVLQHQLTINKMTV